MGLAVLLDAVGKRLQSPIFGLADRPAALLEDRAEALEKRVDLLGGNILPRQEYMLIERHGSPFLLRCSGAKPRMGALEGKAQETTLRAETREGGVSRLPLVSGPPFSLRPERLLVADL